MPSHARDIATVEERMARLEAESDIRRVMARYMAFCDEPMATTPDFDSADLFTTDLVWEGGEFALVKGRDALLTWFATMRSPDAFRFRLNVHFLTSEAITVENDSATGTWLLLQPALLRDGSGELRMARLRIQFRRTDGGWRIAHFQTETLFKMEPDAARVSTLLSMVRS